MPWLPAILHPQMFTGDREGLVDALIAACERRPAGPGACPGLFGRELVRWDETEEQAPLVNMEALEGGRCVGRTARPRPLALRGTCAALCAASFEHIYLSDRVCRFAIRRRRAGGKFPKTSLPTASATPVATQPAAKRGRGAVGATPPRRGPASYACPALAASPKPEALPMPTTGLLSRALVRGRSPSPPKEAPFLHATGAHALVRVAAA